MKVGDRAWIVVETGFLSQGEMVTITRTHCPVLKTPLSEIRVKESNNCEHDVSPSCLELVVDSPGPSDTEWQAMQYDPEVPPMPSAAEIAVQRGYDENQYNALRYG